MIVELPTIVCYQGIQDPVLVDKVPPYEVDHLFLCDLAEGFYLDPFCKIVYGYCCILSLPLSLWQQPNKIDSPLRKWPWRSHKSELLWWLGGEIGKTLATHAAFGFLLCVLVHLLPEISLPKSFVGKEFYTRMVSTNPFMHFPQYVIRIVHVQV